jgi:hypothetical protein
MHRQTRSHTLTQARNIPLALGVATALLLAGCGGGENEGATSGTGGGGQEKLPENLFVAQPPSGVQTVEEIKAQASQGDGVVVRAVVGGRKNPFVEGRALLTAVDASLPNACTRPGHGCPEPWDYCCADREKLAASMVTIQIGRADGQLLAAPLSQGGRIEPMDTLVVKGTVARQPTAESLVVSASEIFVEKAN